MHDLDLTRADIQVTTDMRASNKRRERMTQSALCVPLANDVQSHEGLQFFSACMQTSRKRCLSSCNHVDALPLEVLGTILSRLDCVRSVAMASMTCKKWQRAVRTWLFKITCSFPVLQACESLKLELITTAVVKQAAYLQDLCIINGKISAPTLWNWLLIRRNSLKSLSFLSRTRRDADILKRLSDLQSNIEKFEWRGGLIRKSNLILCRLPHLKSLTLDRVSVGPNCVEDVQLLFATLSKLEHVSLANISIRKAAVRVVLKLPSCLKTLVMKCVRFVDDVLSPTAADDTIVLNGVNLLKLDLTEFSVENNMSLEVDQVKSLQHLAIQDSSIVGLRFASCFEHLAIWNTPVRRLDVGNLKSLVALTLFNLQTIWPLYLKIKQRTSMKMRKLQLLGGLPTFSVEDLYIIALRFPKLHRLSLYHQDTLLFGQSTKKLPVFVQLVDFELYVNNKVTNHDGFVGCVLKLLQCCPNLRRMAIKLQSRSSKPWAEELEFPSKVASLLKQAVRPHTHVRVCVMEELNKIFA